MKVRKPTGLVVLYLKNTTSLQGDILVRRRCSAFYLCLKSHRRKASSTSSSQGTVVSDKSAAGAVSVPKEISTNMGTQLRTASSLFMELIRSTSPSVKSSILSIGNLAKRMPFMSVEPIKKEDSSAKENTTSEAVKTDSKTLQQSYFGAFGGIQAAEKTEIIPKWKVKRRSAVSQESIDSRTKHVVSAVAKAVSTPSLQIRLEDLCNHLFQYPQAKSLAAREGAVSVLIRLKHRTKDDEQVLRQIREGLALLGHTEPLPSRGIRILSIDGGGTRGLLALRILRHIEETTKRPIYESFDFICGVSTGAVLALLMGAGKKSISEVEAMYRQISSEVFRQDRSSGLGGLLWSHAYYNTEKWEKILKEKIGETPMIRTARDSKCLKVAAVSSIVNQEVVRPYVFRNYTLPFRIQSLYSGSFRHKMWEAVRASSAAPGYFGEFKLEDNIHQDGGLFVNNPCAVAIHEAKCIWPNAKLTSVVSIGTGRCQPLDLAVSGNDSASTSWKQKLSKVIDSATDTERVHTVLHDLLPPKVYYRFNPYLSEVHGLDETDPLIWSRMLDEVDMYIRKNQSKIDQAAATLSVPRTAYQSMHDWVTERRFLLENSKS